MDLKSFFSSVQHWINEVFSVSDQQSAPIIITLLVFITGWLLTLIVGGLKSYQLRSAIRRQVFPLLKSLSTDALKQSKKYHETIDTLNLEGIVPFSQGKVDFYQIPALMSLGYSKIFEALFLGPEHISSFIFRKRKERMGAFTKCWNAISSISFWQDRALKDMEFIMSKYNIGNEERNNHLLEFEKLFSELFRKARNNNNHEIIQYIQEVNTIRQKWQQLPNQVGPIVIHENLVEPVLKISENNLLDDAQIIRFCVYKAFNEYSNMKRMMDVYKQQYKIYSEQFDNYSKDLENSYKILYNLCQC